jgi:hypothetical protein
VQKKPSRWTALPLAATLTLLTTMSSGAWAHDDNAGREWRPIGQTMGIGRLSWDQLAAVCPPDGQTACTGVLNGVPLNDWVWGSKEQVRSLFARYAPAILSADAVGGFEYFTQANQALTDLGFTSHTQGCPTYQGCFNFKEATGVTSTAVAGSSPAAPWWGRVWADLANGNGGGFHIAAPFNPDTGRGLWMWRATGKDTGRVHAYDDASTLSRPGPTVALPNVLANDWIGGVRPTTATVALAQRSATHAALRLDPATGAVHAEVGLPTGTHRLEYVACAIGNPANCDDAVVTVTVPLFPIVAKPDTGSIEMLFGGVAIADVVANDTLGGQPTSLVNVSLHQVSSTHPNVNLNTATGAVHVAPGTPNLTQVVTYAICDRLSPTRCSQTTATVFQAPPSIKAGWDYARASSKYASTPIRNVLANDYLRGAVATTSTVTLSVVAMRPANPIVRLDTTTGAVSVLGRTSSITQYIDYRICEKARPANCSQASVQLYLSGGL